MGKADGEGNVVDMDVSVGDCVDEGEEEKDGDGIGGGIQETLDDDEEEEEEEEEGEETGAV